MPLSSYPLIAWGDADDISASPWTNGGVPAVAGGVDDPFGGTDAYTITDDAAVNEYRIKPLTVPARVQPIEVFARFRSSAGSTILVQDQTDGVPLFRINIAWSGGVPTITGLTGTLHHVISCGAGWYLFRGLSIVPNPAHTNQLRLYPTVIGTGVETGATDFYLRRVALLDVVDRAISGDEPRAGSEFERMPSGVEDAWVVGWDEIFEGQIRWVPPLLTDGLSGWYGQDPAIGVDCGVKAMLRAGREKQPLVWVPDRSACRVNQSVYLAAPLQGIPDPEPNGYRRFGIKLVSDSVFEGL
jgi:hypothetical protein